MALAAASCQWWIEDRVGGRGIPKLTRAFSLQMADSGGLPQVTQVSLPSFLSQLRVLGPEARTGAVPG